MLNSQQHCADAKSLELSQKLQPQQVHTPFVHNCSAPLASGFFFFFRFKVASAAAVRAEGFSGALSMVLERTRVISGSAAELSLLERLCA